jgi:hypothetical protein
MSQYVRLMISWSPFERKVVIAPSDDDVVEAFVVALDSEEMVGEDEENTGTDALESSVLLEVVAVVPVDDEDWR